jgi:hypothetical protein
LCSSNIGSSFDSSAYQAVTRLECRRERIQPQHVLIDFSRLDRDGAGVRVVRVALGGAVVELAM